MICQVYLLLLLTLTALVSKAYAADTPSFRLQNNSWEQLVVPGNSSTLTIRDMFADDLPAAGYGSDWALFIYDAPSGAYVDPGIDGNLNQGVGFWIIQTTGSVVALDLPDSLGLATTIDSAACDVDSCSEVPVYAQANQSVYNMVGSALVTLASIEQTKLRTAGEALLCGSGCSLNDATGYQYIGNALWHYDSSAGEYVDLVEVGQIGPWQGVWLQTKTAMAATNADVLFPAIPAGPVPEDADAARLLAQASFGPSSESIDDVRRLGIAGWVDNQFTLSGDAHLAHSKTFYPQSSSLSGPRQNKWLLDAVEGQDQLRLRIAFAYSEIFVTSDRAANLTPFQYGMANYYDILRDNAFGNFRDLLERVTLSPIMGLYLNMLQNEKSDPASNTRADESFARELMQLFSIGLYELNLDGTTKIDAAGNPIPAYTLADISEYARVFTGWDWNNAERWGLSRFDSRASKIEQMTPFPGFHDEGQKNLLRGVVSPAGISAEEDLANALDSLFNHPNVGPFIGKQLIQRLVTSNPTPGYVARVASVFNDNGDGVRGDMQAVVRAILLDSEARDGYLEIPNYGKLREPLLRWTHLWRAFNVQRGSDSLPYEYNHSSPYIESAYLFMGQSVLSAASVFNFYRPDYAPLGVIRDAGLVAPEAQIYTQAYFLTNTAKISALTQVNNHTGNDNALRVSYIDVTSEVELARSSDALLDHLNLVLLSGQMSSGLRQVLLEHFENFDSNEEGREIRVLDAINLIMASPEYLVQK